MRKAWNKEDTEKIPVAMRLGETPVLIPNTKVKTQTADGTILETIWESRWLPEHQKQRTKVLLYKKTKPIPETGNCLAEACRESEGTGVRIPPSEIGIMDSGSCTLKTAYRR